MLQYASVVELIFFMLSMVAVVFWGYQVWESLRDSTFQSVNKINGQIRTVTEIAGQQAWMKLIGGLVMLVASVFFLSAVPPPPPYSDLPASLVGVVAWIMIALRDVAESILLKRARMHVIAHTPIEIQQTVRMLPPPGDSSSVQREVEIDKKLHEREVPERHTEDTLELDKIGKVVGKAVEQTLEKIEENTAAIEKNTATHDGE